MDFKGEGRNYPQYAWEKSGIKESILIAGFVLTTRRLDKSSNATWVNLVHPSG